MTGVGEGDRFGVAKIQFHVPHKLPLMLAHHPLRPCSPGCLAAALVEGTQAGCVESLRAKEIMKALSS